MIFFLKRANEAYSHLTLNNISYEFMSFIFSKSLYILESDLCVKLPKLHHAIFYSEIQNYIPFRKKMQMEIECSFIKVFVLTLVFPWPLMNSNQIVDSGKQAWK